jgi:ABC-type antimicrobial peptide transport system permease subunit
MNSTTNALSRFTLLLRNLTYFRWANLAVVAGMAVATAVLTGALMVGDSVRASLRELAESRLEFVDHALVSPRFVDQSLAKRVADHPEFKQRFESVTPGITLRGGAATADDRNHTAGVQIAALAGRYPVPANEAIVNAALAESLGIADPARATGLRFNVPAPDEAPKDATLARRGRGENILTVGVSKVQIAPPGGFLAMFNLAGGQRPPRNAWVNLDQLQRDIDRPGQVDLLLVTAKAGRASRGDADSLNHILGQAATLADYGLHTTPSADKSQVAIGSSATYVPPPVVETVQKLGAECGVAVQRASVYLINHVHKTSGDRAEQKTIHYAIAAGIDRIDGRPLGEFEVAVNQWTADRLGLKLGDMISLEYYIRKPNGDLDQVWSELATGDRPFTVAKILPMTGIGADRTLTPEYKGLTDSNSISNWNPPEGLVIDKKLVTKEDEDYWAKYKAAPKLLLNFQTATKLWGSAFGDVTSLRIAADKADAFTSELVRRIDPRTLGLAFVPIRAQQLAAATGGTDFSQLFIGFSFFLLVAAMMLVAMLFRLSVEQRARQFGLMSACGFSPKQLRNLALKEGLLLSLIGGILGLLGAVAYTALIVHGLRTWWVDAIGTTALRLHVRPLTLLTGLVSSVVVAMLAIAWSARRIARSRPAALLSGAVGATWARLAKPARKSLIVAAVIAVIAILMFAAGALNRMSNIAAYLGGGAMLLAAALLVTFARLRPSHHAAAALSVPTLAVRNATRNRTRSLLCVALIALASFTLVTVSAMESTTPGDTWKKDSGAGGYRLILESDIPLLGDLNTPRGRDILGIADTANPLWSKASFVGLRSWAGQDISCLNITRPGTPTILAAPHTFMEAMRFTFANRAKDVGNEWTLLDEPQPDGSIPVIADDESAKYILHLGLGETMPLTDAGGRPRQLKLVATLGGSIFQSQMLMGEANFRELFPAQAGYQMVLVETGEQNAADVAKLLSKELDEYAVSVDTTAARLAAYHQVANTYLSTFRVLGSLGLMLGTIGLAVVLVRNLVERRSELALLSALGFSRSTRTRLVLAENAALLLLGLLIGGVCALAGVIPVTMTSARRINARELSVALALVLVVGLVSLMIATAVAGRRITPAALRAE